MQARLNENLDKIKQRVSNLAILFLQNPGRKYKLFIKNINFCYEGESYAKEKTGWQTGKKCSANHENNAIYYENPYRFYEYVR